MTTWLSADWHLGHEGMIAKGWRPRFTSVEQMEETIIGNVLDVVKPGDNLWLLGDTYMGRQPRVNIPRITGLLPVQPIEVSGNHDLDHPCHKDGAKWKRWMLANGGFKHIFTEAKMAIDGHLVTLCHFPYEGDHTAEERFQDHRPSDKGGWLLHGHVHDKWQRRGRMINVGVDVWDFKPVSMNTLVDMMAQPGD